MTSSTDSMVTRTACCALQQLWLDDPCRARLVIGGKRDTLLPRCVAAAAGDAVTVLDISLDENRDDLERLLDAGASVRCFDHHYAREVPRRQQFEAHLEETPDVCTSTLVDRHLAGRHRSWAIVAAFGDNLPEVATPLADVSSMGPSTTAALERLGISLNYNAYGATIGGLCLDSADLTQLMQPRADVIEFSRHSLAYAQLVARYAEDMQRARTLKTRPAGAGGHLRRPARRSVGKARDRGPRQRSDPNATELRNCDTLLAPKAEGSFTVSVYPFRLTPPKLGGTDIAHAVPLTPVPGLGHVGLGNVDLHLLGHDSWGRSLASSSGRV